MSARRDLSGGKFIATVHSTTYEYISPLKLNLAGKHVLITGAAWENGIGYATAKAFARAGASAIVLADLHGITTELVLNLKAAATEAGRPEPAVLGCEVDIAQHDSVRAMYNNVSQVFGGRLDIVVNNAAHQEPYRPILEADTDVDWRTWEVNVHGLINMTRAFLPMQLSTHTRDKGLCTIINVSSSGALTARPGSASYRSSKLAILRWTETLQLDYGDKGLLAYCVNPGAIKTEITRNEPRELRDALPHRPDIAGDTIAWLAAERKDWLGGRYVHCPWDMEELLKKKDEIVADDKLKMRMKKNILDRIKCLYLPYTVIDVGWWYQLSLPPLPSGRIHSNFQYSITQIVGAGNKAWALIDNRDIGKYVPRIITDPRTLNKSIFAYGEVWTQNNVWNMLERLSGESFIHEYVNEKDLLKTISGSKVKIEENNVEAGSKLNLVMAQYKSVLGIRGDNTPEHAKYLGYLDVKDLYPDITPTALESFIKEALKKPLG